MQETFNPQMDPEAKEAFREYFEQGPDESEAQLVQRMDNLAAERGHTVIKRAKIGRNELCPCGSGRKFKKCCIEELR